MAAAAHTGLELKVPFCATRSVRSHAASPRWAIMDMMAFRPTTAAPGRPPATILASVVMSGVTPKYAWAPPGA